MAERSHHRAKAEPQTIEEVEKFDEEGQGDSILGRVKRGLGMDPRPADKPAPKPKSRIPAGKPTEEEIASLVAVVNLPVVMISPRDALTDWECQRMTAALEAYKNQSETARRFMYGALSKAALGALLSACAAIAFPRMIRHGWLPPALAPYLTGICDASQLADAVGFEPPAAQSQNGAAPGYEPLVPHIVNAGAE